MRGNWGKEAKLLGPKSSIFGAMKAFPPIYLLPLPGFDESRLIQVLVSLRERSLGVALVGLTQGDMRGAHGVGMQFDLTLDQALAAPPHLLVLAGGQMSQAILATEPRLRRLQAQAGQVTSIEKLAAYLDAGFIHTRLDELLTALTDDFQTHTHEDGS